MTKVIERELARICIGDNDILDIAPKATLEELNTISDELLNKAGLVEMNEKLKAFEV